MTKEKENPKKITIGLIELASSEVEAQAKGLTTLLELPFNLMGLTWKKVLPFNHPDAIREIEGLWDETLDAYIADLVRIDKAISSSTNLPTRDMMINYLLSNPVFRAACYRIGVLHGNPIRLYGPSGSVPERRGVTERALLDDIREGYDPDKLWLLVTEVTPISYR